MTRNIYNISNYDEIIIEEKSLVILDIDETIFKFKNIDCQWWKDNIENYEKLGYNNNEANNLIYDVWTTYIQENDPILLDKDKLLDLFDRIEKSNSHLIMLSARTENIREITHNNLLKCNIKIDDSKLYFSKEKGYMINKLLEKYDDYKNIIFVDDLEKNILDVKNKLYNCEVMLNLYIIKHINLLDNDKTINE
jgi:hypothetical protein